MRGDATPSLIMATRTGSAVWEGTLKAGKGNMKLGSGAFDGPYSFSSRFENGKGTNPEELIGAARGCLFFDGACVQSGEGRSSRQTRQHQCFSETGARRGRIQ